MTEEVAQLVLRDNYQQTQALSNAVAQAASMADVHARYIHALEQSGKLNRELEFLPSEEELAERKSNDMGLTAPEFAVLLAYTKITFYRELLKSDVMDDPYLSGELERYFPTPLRERFRDRLKGHRLRRELMATHVTNSMVNRCGTSFAFRLEAQRQTRMLLEGRRLVERATRWLLRNRRTPLDIAATVSHFSEGAAEISELLLKGGGEDLHRATEQLVEANVPPELARRVAALGTMFSALDIVDVADATDQPVQTAAEAYFALGDRLRLHWLRAHVEALPRDNRWRSLARAALRDDLYGQQAGITAENLRATPEDLPAAQRIDAWVEANRISVERVLQVLTDINASGAFDLATLSVARREVRNLITSSSPSPAVTPAG